MGTKTRTRPVSSHSVPRPDGGAAVDVRRDEFTGVSAALKDVNNVTREEFVTATSEIRQNMRQLQVQFTRIAQMQADIDFIKATLAKMTNTKTGE